MSKEEEDTAVERPNFTGVWVLVRMENHDAFMKVRIAGAAGVVVVPLTWRCKL